MTGETRSRADAGNGRGADVDRHRGWAGKGHVLSRAWQVVLTLEQPFGQERGAFGSVAVSLLEPSGEAAHVGNPHCGAVAVEVGQVGDGCLGAGGEADKRLGRAVAKLQMVIPAYL